MDCIFCKIAEGKIPSLGIYDDSRFMAFLDINPRAHGHVLVIPKKHVSAMEELPDDNVAELFLVVKKISTMVSSRLGASGYNIFINNGQAAGQIIPHLHVHILPRYGKEQGDSGFAIEAPFPVREDAKARLKEIQEKIKEDMENKYSKEIISW